MGADERKTLKGTLIAGHFQAFVKQVIGGSGSLQAEMVQGTGGTFVLRVVSTGLGFITSVVLARILGAESYGTYAYAFSWVAVLVIPATMGMPTLLTRDVSKYDAKGDWGSLRGILRWSDRIVLAASMGLAFLGVAVIWLFGGDLGRQTQTTLWVSVTLLPFLAFVRIRKGSLRGLGHVVKSQLPQKFILKGAFLLFIGFAYLFIELSAPVAMGLRALAAGVACLTAVALVRSYLPDASWQTSPEYHRRDWANSAFPLLLIAGADVLDQRISVIMLGSMVGPEAAGVFDVARRGVGFVAFCLGAVNMPLAPIIARLYTNGQKERMQQVVTKAAQVALIGSTPIAGGLIFYGEYFFQLYGGEFTRGTMALSILCVGQLINATVGSVVQIFNMTNNEYYIVWTKLSASTFNVMLNLFLIPRFDIEGAALAVTISMMTWNILLSVLIYKKLNINTTVVGNLV